MTDKDEVVVTYKRGRVSIGESATLHDSLRSVTSVQPPNPKMTTPESLKAQIRNLIIKTGGRKALTKSKVAMLVGMTDRHAAVMLEAFHNKQGYAEVFHSKTLDGFDYPIATSVARLYEPGLLRAAVEAVDDAEYREEGGLYIWTLMNIEGVLGMTSTEIRDIGVADQQTVDRAKMCMQVIAATYTLPNRQEEWDRELMAMVLRGEYGVEAVTATVLRIGSGNPLLVRGALEGAHRAVSQGWL